MSSTWRSRMNLSGNKTAPALLALAVLAAYANALWWGTFQFDDYNVIVFRDGVHSWQAWWRELGHGIRPLLKLTYTLDWTLGWGERGFHLTNLCIHLGNVLLAWELSRRYLARFPGLRSRAAGIAFAVALLYALHPAHTEAVAYISGRSSSLMALCYLGGLLAYLAGRDAGGAWGRLLRFGATPLLFVLALAAKETAITFPLALLLAERAWGGNARQALRRQWPVWLLGLSALFFFAVDSHYGTQMLRSLAHNNGPANLATQANGFFYLLQQWIFPLHLNIDPDLPVFSRAAAAWPQLSALLLAALLAAAWLARPGKRPWLGFALAWALLHLVLLYLLAPRLDVANERQLYLTSWPLLLALMIELSLLLDKQRLVPLVAALTLITLGLTVARNRDYAGEVRLWEATVRLSPGKARPHNNLGYAYWLQGRHDEARAQYQSALAIDPANVNARENLRWMAEE